MKVNIVFDGPPAAESGRFIEVETVDGQGLDRFIGKWVQHPTVDGWWALQVDVQDAIDPKAQVLAEVLAEFHRTDDNNVDEPAAGDYAMDVARRLLTAYDLDADPADVSAEESMRAKEAVCRQLGHSPTDTGRPSGIISCARCGDVLP